MDISSLQAAGVNVDNVLDRCMGNKDLVLKLFDKFLHDQNYMALKTAIDSEDIESALAASHTLKGVCANLAFDNLYKLFSHQVDLIRQGSWPKAVSLMGQIDKEYCNLSNAIKNII